MGNVSFQKKEDITQAMQLILARTSNLMSFDLVHVYAPQYNRQGIPLWAKLKAGLKE